MAARGAVFLSYASQDAEAAARICAALRATGIEVWFDQSELRGGDLWDQKIRQQIRDCALFMPVISAHTEERPEGYFRREWRLAVERTRDMADDQPFLLPVVIDTTGEGTARVPERFRELQWLRLAGGWPTPAFLEHVQQLLSPTRSPLPAASPAATAPAAIAAAPTAPAATAPGAAGAAPGGARTATRAWWLIAFSVAALALLVIGYLTLGRHATNPPLVAAGSDARSAAPTSIAVLPFANESGDSSQQYFSDGLSEDLITALAQLPGLKVIGRTSSFRFRDSKEDSRTIGDQLGVTHLLEGSVRRAGDTVRVSAELITSSDGSALWSERYDRPYRDLFVLQDEITRAVAGALKTKLFAGSARPAQSDRPPGGSLEAYNALLQGKFHAERNTEPDLRKAIEYFTTARRLDPRYALAWSMESRVWSGLAEEFLENPAAQAANAQARVAAEMALTLAPDLAAAHIARGFLLQGADLDWRGSQAEYERAVALAPDDDEARFRLGSQLAVFGQVQRAIELTQQSLANDPMRARWWHWLAIYELALDRLDAAQAAFDRAIELQPGAAGYHFTLTTIKIRRGDAAAALSAAQQEVEGIWRLAALALARQLGADRAAADGALKSLIDKYADGASYQVAEVYALRKDADATFTWLDRAWATRDPGISALLIDPLLRPYQRDPRFAAFCRKVGLPPPAEADK